MNSTVTSAISVAGMMSSLENARQKQNKAILAVIEAMREVELLEDAIIQATMAFDDDKFLGVLSSEDVAMGDMYPTFDPDCVSFPAGWEATLSGGFSRAEPSLTSNSFNGKDEQAITWAQKGAM